MARKRAMPLDRIENKAKRRTTFAKRKIGLLKKARELSILCDAEVAAIVFSEYGNPCVFCSRSSVQETLERYMKFGCGKDEVGSSSSSTDTQGNFPDYSSLLARIEVVERELRYIRGEALDQLSFSTLQQLEKQMAVSIEKVRTKHNILYQRNMGWTEELLEGAHSANGMLWNEVEEISSNGQGVPRSKEGSAHQAPGLPVQLAQGSTSSIPFEPLTQNVNEIRILEAAAPMERVESTGCTEEGRENDSTHAKNKKKVQIRSRCKEVTRPSHGGKLRVTFYNNRVVGDYYTLWSRHLGQIVRDTNKCPLRVHSWKDIGKEEKQRMWEAVIENFENDEIEIYRESTLRHMNVLWNNWRASLNKKYIKSCKTPEEAVRNVPGEFHRSDWEWLVKEHFLSTKFQESSKRNSINRAQLQMLHHTGSKPFREIIYEMGGKDGNPPNLAAIFYQTRKKGEKLVELEAIKKLDEIRKVIESEPTLSETKLIERCFGPIHGDHVVGYGGGVRPKDLKGSRSFWSRNTEK